MILGYSGDTTPAWNAYIIGLAIVVMAAAAIWTFQKWEEWINALLGLWLIASPWVLGYSTMQTPLWNQIIVGVIAGGLALWAALAEPRGSTLATK